MARDGTKTGGGSRKGIPNKATADIKALAQQYTPAAIEALARLAGLLEEGRGMAESEQARVAAIKELIDRGHGKASQTTVLEDAEGNNPLAGITVTYVRPAN